MERYIRLLKLFQTALMFVEKKDSKQIVQNYKYLNKQTIKNKYSLLLISDIIENIMKKVFTKLFSQYAQTLIFYFNLILIYFLDDKEVHDRCQVHKWWTQFFFILLFIFIFILFYFSIFYFENNQGQGRLVTLSHQSQPDGIVTRQITRCGRIQQKIQEQMISYNIDTTGWSYELHMVVQGRVHSSQHGPSVELYKVDQFVEEFSIKFSYITQYKSCSFV